MLLVPPSDSDVMLPTAEGGWVPLGPVVAGVPVEVPDWAVGRAPDPQIETVCARMNAATASIEHGLRASLRDQLIELDAGCGLLASGWTIYTPVKGNKVKEITV
jgi:hypothetical protein